ncbi:MAG TPA: amino acid permease, partial [Alphaproteobacteria bacterium]|nr:amino acid permease [Alphaproteobacteria bacterium]
RGAAAYLGDLAPIPLPLGAAGLVILFTGIACLGVRQSVGIAAVMTFAELLGLAYVIIA